MSVVLPASGCEMMAKERRRATSLVRLDWVGDAGADMGGVRFSVLGGNCNGESRRVG